MIRMKIMDYDSVRRRAVLCALQAFEEWLRIVLLLARKVKFWGAQCLQYTRMPRSKVEDAALRSGPKIDKYLGYHSISDSRPVGCGSSDWVNWDSRESLLEYTSSTRKYHLVSNIYKCHKM